MIGSFFSLNGQLLPKEQAVVSVDHIEFSYGFGVYESLKVRNRILYFPELHIDRLFLSAQTLSLPCLFSKKQVLDFLHEFINSVSEESFNIKMILIGKNQGKESDLYIFALNPLYLPSKSYTQGIKVITFLGERQFIQAKSLNMLMSYLAFKQAREQKAHDALLVDSHNCVLEGTRTNFFFTDGITIFSPSVEKVLNGVTRITLLDALKKNKIPFKEKDLNVNELSNYSGFFVTSTSANVLPVSEIDGKKFKIPDIVKKVISAYDQHLEAYAKSAKKV
ncbi:MAG: aminotransferase class IV [Candidatus Diapherotrites archaeon]|nr:aminotransferase class IV [Candidatus Diapherotrites archaeon]